MNFSVNFLNEYISLSTSIPWWNYDDGTHVYALRTYFYMVVKIMLNVLILFRTYCIYSAE